MVLIVPTAGGTVAYRGRRPTTIDFSGDATNIVGHLTWATWDSKTAVGHGTWADDNCRPSCASGTITDVPATITLSDAVNGHFTAMREAAGQLDRSYRYPGDWATGAS